MFSRFFVYMGGGEYRTDIPSSCSAMRINSFQAATAFKEMMDEDFIFQQLFYLLFGFIRIIMIYVVHDFMFIRLSLFGTLSNLE